MSKNKSTVTERRSYTIDCRRQVAENCEVTDRLTAYESKQDPTSLTAAEKSFREQGWTLHTNGTATCKPCMDRWKTPPETEEGTDAED